MPQRLEREELLLIEFIVKVLLVSARDSFERFCQSILERFFQRLFKHFLITSRLFDNHLLDHIDVSFLRLNNFQQILTVARLLSVLSNIFLFIQLFLEVMNFLIFMLQLLLELINFII